MATKYSDIIRLRSGRSAYSIEEEERGEWTSFIPNEQFNQVLQTVIKAVRGDDIDCHKSFWINGTYGTGKSHAVAVISHLMCDDVNDIKEWIDYEYRENKFETIKTDIYSLRECKRLLPVKVYGLAKIVDPSDLALVLQKTVVDTLKKNGFDIFVQTDFDTYVEHIKNYSGIWDDIIKTNTSLSSIIATREQLIKNLENNDISTFQRVSDALRTAKLDIRMNNESIKQWLIEVQNKLRKQGKYNGLFIIWDEFTDVMKNSVGLPILKELQAISEKFTNKENDSFLFLISHPSAFDNVDSEQLKQTDGRYHRMTYNMESVSAFKIMSRKFDIVNTTIHDSVCQNFYEQNKNLLSVFTQNSNDPNETRLDLQNLFPLHPGTANLATHYATVVGSSSRSVFEFLGDNEAIQKFLENEDFFLERRTITADYLWDYVFKVFQDDGSYSAITGRYNLYCETISEKGDAYLSIFKGILLLNAFNNISISRGNNNGLVTPSEENIHYLFQGSHYDKDIDEVLKWLDEQKIIQRTPTGLYTVQFSTFSSNEINEKREEILRTLKYTSQIFDYAKKAVENVLSTKIMVNVIRPFRYEFYSLMENEPILKKQIKNGRKAAKGSSLFIAFLASRNNTELFNLRTFAENCANETTDEDLKNIVFVVFDKVFGDSTFDKFIEYLANYDCAKSHSILEQIKAYEEDIAKIVTDWLEAIQHNGANIYINGEARAYISMNKFSTIINSSVIPILYPYAPETHENLRRAPKTFWKVQNSSAIVRIFLFAKSLDDINNNLNGPMRPMINLLQDCLNNDLTWKENIPENHPLKRNFDEVNSVIEKADKNSSFKFNEKFSPLTKPPYGLYSCYAAMGMMAFALRPWAGKIFDTQGKPRDANALENDISLLFDVWDKNKSDSTLEFKFQSPEESRLCKDLIYMFRLHDKNNKYNDATSLKDTRYAIVNDFLDKKKAPLWVIKYAPDSVFGPAIFEISDDIKKLIDNIVRIISPDEDLRDSEFVNETASLIERLRIEMRNILNVEDAFTEGFKTYLMQLKYVNVKVEEVDNLKEFIVHQLESSIGYWTEAEVENSVKNWRLMQSEQQLQEEKDDELSKVSDVSNSDGPTNKHPSDLIMISNKRSSAKARISNINSLEEAKNLLNKLCDSADEQTLDIIDKYV